MSLIYYDDKKFLAYSKNNELGFIDYYNYITYLVENSNDNEYFVKWKKTNKASGDYDLKKLKDSYFSRRDYILRFFTDLKNIMIVMDNDLLLAEKQLESLEKILPKLDQGLCPDVYKKILRDIDFLRNFKIGNSVVPYYKVHENSGLSDKNFKKLEEYIYKDYVVYEEEQTKKIINGQREYKKYVSGSYQTTEIDAIKDDLIQKIVKKIVERLDRVSVDDNLYLKLKAKRSLSELLKNSENDAEIIMTNKNFRKKIFKKFDHKHYESIFTDVKKHVEECEKINNFLDIRNENLSLCPFCNFTSSENSNVKRHIENVHCSKIYENAINKTEDRALIKKYEDEISLINKNNKFLSKVKFPYQYDDNESKNEVFLNEKNLDNLKTVRPFISDKKIYCPYCPYKEIHSGGQIYWHIKMYHLFGDNILENISKSLSYNKNKKRKIKMTVNHGIKWRKIISKTC